MSFTCDLTACLILPFSSSKLGRKNLSLFMKSLTILKVGFVKNAFDFFITSTPLLLNYNLFIVIVTPLLHYELKSKKTLSHLTTAQYLQHYSSKFLDLPAIQNWV